MRILQRVRTAGLMSRWADRLPRHPLARRAVLTLGAVVVALVLGALVGAVTASPSTQPYESGMQTRILQDRSTLGLALAGAGAPDQWVVADGPVKPGGDTHRIEVWVYELGEDSWYVTWLNGVAVNLGRAPSSGYERDESLPTPNRFHRGMTVDDVMEILDEEPTYLVVEDEPFRPSTTYLFKRAQLAMSFYEDRLLTVQTW